jgi:2'-5' RNA ligase
MAAAGGDTVTIGVAIAVPEPHATTLRRYRASFGDAQAHAVPTHVTLAPPLTVPANTLGGVEQHLAEVAARYRPFTVRLRGTGTFRPVSAVVFITVAQGISECELLAAAVRRGLPDVPASYPYHPHVTVAHHLDDEALDRAFDTLADYRADFTVDDFVLYAHDPDQGWRRHAAFRLRGR